MTSGLHWKPWARFLLLRQSEFLPQIHAGTLYLLLLLFIPLRVCFSIRELRPRQIQYHPNDHYARVDDSLF